MLSALCTFSIIQVSHGAEGVQQLMYILDQSATPQARLALSDIEAVVVKQEFLDEYMILCKKNSSEFFALLAKHLNHEVTLADRIELVETLKECADWYIKMLNLATDVQRLQTQESQEAFIQHQMGAMQFLQKPLLAALMLRMIEVSNKVAEDPAIVDGPKRVFGEILQHAFDEMKEQLLKD